MLTYALLPGEVGSHCGADDHHLLPPVRGGRHGQGQQGWQPGPHGVWLPLATSKATGAEGGGSVVQLRTPATTYVILVHC